MGLHLAVFDEDTEVAGVEVGSYEDFGVLRDYVTNVLESGRAGSRFPTLIMHADSDGEWTVDECRALLAELAQIALERQSQPAVPFNSAWQKQVARFQGVVPKTALESFIDVDGEMLIERIAHLARTAVARNLSIQFQ